MNIRSELLKGCSFGPLRNDYDQVNAWVVASLQDLFHASLLKVSCGLAAQLFAGCYSDEALTCQHMNTDEGTDVPSPVLKDLLEARFARPF